MPRLIDISPLVSERLSVFPGDVPYVRQTSRSLAAGDTLDLSSMCATVHIGAHADAPSHYVRGGAGIDARPLEPYFGPCQVVEVRTPPGARIRPDHLCGDLCAPRLLFKTGSFPDPEVWRQEFVALSSELVEFVHARGVRLVGI